MDAPLIDSHSPIDIHQARIDLAAALRWAVRLGLHEGICNHFSLAVSPGGDRFLVNPYGLHWSEIRSSDLLLVNADGTVEDGREPPEATAFFIHSRLHLRLPHGRCVLHTHMPYATALTSLADPEIQPISQNALRFYNRVAYDHDYNGLVLDAGEGDRLARALGNKSVMFLANHGVIVLGGTVAEAFDSLYYLERAAENQVLAYSTGRTIRCVPDGIAEKTASQIAATGDDAAHRHFAALKRILDREEPDYAL